VFELNLTCSFIEINDTYFYLDSVSFPVSVPLILAAQSRPHEDHIYVHVHIDVLHECSVAVHADLGCTLLRN
jgi:hypothetical protein